MARALLGLALVLLALGAWILTRHSSGGASPTTPTKRAPVTGVASASTELTDPGAPPPGGRPSPGGPGADPSLVVATAESDTRSEAPRVDQPVLLFEHAEHDLNFPGRRWWLLPGEHASPGGFDGDAASCVRVPEGLRLVLYDHDDFTGPRVVLGPGLQNLAPYGFNDRASSARVLRDGEPLLDVVPKRPSDAVVLYEHRPSDDPTGARWRLSAGETSSAFFSSRDGYFDARAVSAVWVPEGWELVLFVEPDGRGLAMVLGPGFHELETVGFEDRAQSVRMSRLEER